MELGDHVAIGGTYVNDELSTGGYELAGLDAEVRPNEGTRLIFEYADSSGNDSLTFLSDDGGLTYTPVLSTGQEEGSAWKATAELDVGSWFGRPDRHHVDVYYKMLDGDFFSNGNFLEQGTEKTGVHASFAVTDRDVIQFRHDRVDRTDASAAPGTADEARLSSAQWRHQRERWRLEVEYLGDEAEDSTGVSVRDSSLGAARFWVRLMDKLTVDLEHQATLSGPDNDQTTAGLEYQLLPKLALSLQGTDGDRGSSARAGVAWTIGESEIYLKSQLLNDAGSERASTIVGARSPLGKSSKIYTEYQIENDDRGERTISLFGLQRQWEPTPGFRFVLSGESSNVDTPTTADRRFAVGVGVTYSNNKGFTLVSRNELRRETGDTENDQYVTFTQVDYRWSRGLQLLGKYRYSKTEDRDTDLVAAKFNERSIALAYRPVHHDRFNGLAQYTRLLDFRPSTVGQPQSARTMDVLSLETLFEVHPRLEWVTKTAGRFQEQIDATGTVESNTLLAIQRLNVDVWRPIALGVEFRLLGQREADDLRQGWLGEVMWKIQKHFRVGGGYNFTDFSDNEFSQNDYSIHGWFLRVQGRY